MSVTREPRSDLKMIDPLYVASGFGVGLLVGMTGVGGGSLMTPLLILLFGIHPSTAVGTDLLYASATKVGGSVVLCFALILTASSLIFRKTILDSLRWRMERFDDRAIARATVLVGALLGVL